MKECYECGKKLSFWNSYYHPTLGRKVSVCWKCHEKIGMSLKKYRDFVLNEFKYNNQKNNIGIRKSKHHPM